MLQLAKYPDMLTDGRAGLRTARRDLLPARSGRELPQLLRRRAHPGGRRGCQAGPAGADRRHGAGVAQWPGGAGCIGSYQNVRDTMRLRQRGGTFLGIVIGVVIGLGAALAVAVYVTQVPVPFLNKSPPRKADQDAAESLKNKDWDPNAPLYGKNPARAAAPAASAASRQQPRTLQSQRQPPRRRPVPRPATTRRPPLPGPRPKPPRRPIRWAIWPSRNQPARRQIRSATSCRPVRSGRRKMPRRNAPS